MRYVIARCSDRIIKKEKTSSDNVRMSGLPHSASRNLLSVSVLRKNRSKSTFARNVITLMTGTSIAQAIPIAISPILTRMYSPEDFGLLAIYMSCVAILSVVATGKYELAIALPVSDIDAANIGVLALKICAAVSCLLTIPIFMFGNSIAQILGNRDIASWLYLLPLSVFSVASFNTFQFWCNRNSDYRAMSANRIQNAGLSAGASVGFGVAKVHAGQIIGTLLGQFLAVGWIARKIWKQDRKVFAGTNVTTQLKLARDYAAHPKHVAPSQLLGVIATQIPNWIVSHFYSLNGLGFFSLAYRLVSLPTGLIASAIGDVYRQKIAVAYQEHGEFRQIFLKTLRTTSILAIFPFGIMYVVAPSLFAFVFGESWRIAGDYARILVVASFFQFVFTPVDKGGVVVGATKYIFFWHVARLTMFLLLAVSVKYLHLEIVTMLWAFVAINTTLYITEGVVGYFLSKGACR